MIWRTNVVNAGSASASTPPIAEAVTKFPYQPPSKFLSRSVPAVTPQNPPAPLTTDAIEQRPKTK
jgi:hypothetical protein